MNFTRLSEVDPGKQRDVITLGDYGTCPTIKSENAINTMIVVKSDGNLQSIQARTNGRDDRHYEPLEIRKVEGLL